MNRRISRPFRARFSLFSTQGVALGCYIAPLLGFSDVMLKGFAAVSILL
jgi:hypothetical protein